MTERRRFADLDRLMLMARTSAQVLQVVSIGAGDAFIERYWPSLRTAVEDGYISLLVVDNAPLKELADRKIGTAKRAGETSAAAKLEDGYKSLMADIEAHRDLHVRSPRWIYFVDLSSPHEQAWLDRIRADVVFVLVPDNAHIKVARRWLKRSTLIMIEKPYDKDYPIAELFEKELKEMLVAGEATKGELPGTVVSPFDHYLAKIHNYVSRRPALAAHIGALRKVEFALLEAGPVEQWRADTLSAGMIYDLFSHVLAMISIELDVGSLQFQHNRTRICVARHKGLIDFPGDTFAHFEFTMRTKGGAPVDVWGQVGKGVGKVDEKYLKLVGEEATLRFEFRKPSLGIYKDMNDRSVSMGDINEGHKDFVESILAGRFQDEKIGWLPGDVALKILRTIYNLRSAIPKEMYLYDPGQSRESLIQEATPLLVRQVA